MHHYIYKTITVDHILPMVELLIERQESECNSFLCLSNTSLNQTHLIDMFKHLFKKNKIIGIGAFFQDKLMGYIIGEIMIFNTKGRYAWVPYEGLAIRLDQPSELIRHLYAKVAVLWLNQGCYNHSIFVPLGNQAYVDACVKLSFAIDQVHAVLDLDTYKPFTHLNEDVVIRFAHENDRKALGELSEIILTYQNMTPLFVPTYPEIIERTKNAFEKLVDEDDVIVLIAQNNHEILGFQEYEMITPHLMAPDHAIELCTAGTYVQHMKNGIGKKLMNESCKVLKEKGYKYITSDWKIANMASSTFWPKSGFTPIAYRMIRLIDPNYAWANINHLML